MKLSELGFTAEETKVMDAAFALLGEKFAEQFMAMVEKEGPCVICQNDDLDKCLLCPALPKKKEAD